MVYASKSSLCHHNKKFHPKNVASHVALCSINVASCSIDEHPQELLKCKYCSVSYKYTSSRYRHEKICKKKNTNSLTIINNNTNINSNNITTTTNNTLNNNNNITNNITINTFSKEDLSYLTTKDIVGMIKRGYCCELEYISKVHQNPDAPQNHNIILSNLRSGLIKIFDDTKWKTVPTNEALDELLYKCHTFLEERYKTYKEKGFECLNFERLLKNIDNNCSETYEKSYPKMKLKLYNEKMSNPRLK